MALGVYTAIALLLIFLTVLAFDITGFFSSNEGFEVDGKVSSCMKNDTIGVKR
jgi:hypothetical protein